MLSRNSTPASWTFAAVALAVVGILVALAAASACGGGDDPIDIIPPPGTATPTLAPSAATAEPTTPPTEFRVAYINLLSPRTLDETNTAPTETFEERLAMVIEELKVFKPDLVAFSEATWTQDLDDAAAVLTRELRMESRFVRTKPWFPGFSVEENDKQVKTLGWEESELVLVRGNIFVPVDGGRTWLNPRTSEIEVPGALWLRVKVPGSEAAVDVFVSHFTGVDATARARQAGDFAQFIKDRRGAGPVLVMGDFGDPPDAPSVQAVQELGLVDAFAGSPVQTCCRAGILNEQPELTSRTDFLFTSGWAPSAVAVFAHEPKKRDDGTLVYASDHNGITAVFQLPFP